MWVNLPWYRIPLSGAFFSLAYWTKHCLVAQDEAEWWLFLPLIVSAAIIKHSNQYMTFLWYSELLLLIGYLHCVNNRWNIEKKSLEAFDPKWSLFGIYAFNSWLGWLDPTGNVLVFQQNFDLFYFVCQWRTEHLIINCKDSVAKRLSADIAHQVFANAICRSEQNRSLIFFFSKKDCAELILTNNLFLGNVRGISVKNSYFYMRSKDLLERRTIMGFVIYTERPPFSLAFLASEFA